MHSIYRYCPVSEKKFLEKNSVRRVPELYM